MKDLSERRVIMEVALPLFSGMHLGTRRADTDIPFGDVISIIKEQQNINIY